jgi:hypothetical protein
MINNNKPTFFKSSLISKLLIVCCITFNFTIFSTNHSFASPTRDRLRSCTPPGGGDQEARVTPEGLDFNPSSGGKDNEFEMDNPVCLTILITSYVAVKTAITIMNNACDSGDKWPRVLPSLLQDSIDIIKATTKAINKKDPGCAGAVTGAVASFGTFMLEIGITYGIAKDGFENTHVCGSEWTRWNANSMLKDTPDRKAQINSIIQGRIRDQNYGTLNMDNEEYRQWYYDGVEKEDNSDDACPDVTRNKNGDKYPPQKYYMRGAQPASYNCQKYNVRIGWKDPLTGNPFTPARIVDYKNAYQCCLQRRANSICLQYGDDYKFCKAGQKCTLDKNGTKITYSSSFLNTYEKYLNSMGSESAKASGKFCIFCK